MNQTRQRQPAGLMRRIAAIAYDSLLLASLMFVFTLLVIFLRGGSAIEPNAWWFRICLIAVSFIFFGWFWTHGGQTLGMRAWRLRLERFDGEPLTWSDTAYRYLAAWLLLLPPGLGFFWAWLDTDKLCWHDRLSSTRVVHVED